MITRKELFELTNHVDDLPVECDGSTRLCGLALIRAQVSHETFVCYLPNGLLHMWIEVDAAEGRTVIDWRLRMWAKGENVPHGVFASGEFTYANVSRLHIGIIGSLALEESLKFFKDFKEIDLCK